MSWVKDNIVDPFTGKTQRKAEEKATRFAEVASDEAVQELRSAQSDFDEIARPAIGLGVTAGDRLRAMLDADSGQNRGEFRFQADDPNFGVPQPEALPELEDIDIAGIVGFLRDEGFEDIQESAAARGRLGAGDTLRDLQARSQQIASTVAPQLIAEQERIRRARELDREGIRQGRVAEREGIRAGRLGEQIQERKQQVAESSLGRSQKFNELFNILGLGTGVSERKGLARLQTGSNVANVSLGLGEARGAGEIGSAQARQLGADNIITGAAKLFGL